MLSSLIRPGGRGGLTRLSIRGLLAAGADWLGFAALRDAAGISDSVLSKQSVVLEDSAARALRYRCSDSQACTSGT